MNDITIVELTPFDAKLFMQFQKHYAFIKLMDSLSVFDVTSGSVTIHFNGSGKIGAVEMNKKYVYNS